MSKNNKSFYMYFVIIISLLLLTVWVGTLRVQNNGYTRGEFEEQLEKNEIAVVNICPNKDVPTGSLEIVLKNGEERVLYVTDVTEMEYLVRSYGIDCGVENVPGGKLVSYQCIPCASGNHCNGLFLCDDERTEFRRRWRRQNDEFREEPCKAYSGR